MAHKRTEIRDALVAMLTGTGPTYATAADARVYANRVHGQFTNKLPSINIVDGQESATPRDIRSTQYVRTWTVQIELRIEDSSGYDTTLDDLAKEVEDLISANRTISGKATSSKYTGTEPSFEQAEKTIGKSVLTYEITYVY